MRVQVPGDTFASAQPWVPHPTLETSAPPPPGINYASTAAPTVSAPTRRSRWLPPPYRPAPNASALAVPDSPGAAFASALALNAGCATALGRRHRAGTRAAATRGARDAAGHCLDAGAAPLHADGNDRGRSAADQQEKLPHSKTTSAFGDDIEFTH